MQPSLKSFLCLALRMMRKRKICISIGYIINPSLMFTVSLLCNNAWWWICWQREDIASSAICIQSCHEQRFHCYIHMQATCIRCEAPISFSGRNHLHEHLTISSGFWDKDDVNAFGISAVDMQWAFQGLGVTENPSEDMCYEVWH